jgi:hypothetical protein
VRLWGIRFSGYRKRSIGAVVEQSVIQLPQSPHEISELAYQLWLERDFQMDQQKIGFVLKKNCYTTKRSA